MSVKPRPDVLMLALARHDGPYSSTAWSLAKAFSRQSRVIFVDNPFTITDLIRGNKKEQIRKRYRLGMLRKAKTLQPEPNLDLLVLVPPVMVPINWLPSGWLYRQLSRLNNRLLKKAVEEVIKEYNFNNYLYINSFNPFYGMNGSFKPAPLFRIYQTVDEIGESNYIAKHGPRLEHQAMKKADAVVATSRQLQKKATSLAKVSAYVPNAADVELFQQALEKELEVPEELNGEKRKVICYIGHVDKRLDYDILVKVAKKHTDKLFLMVGPVSGTEVDSSGFSRLPNVKFTGKKDLKELPAYLRWVHCAIIPFKCNSLTSSIYPLKINEYLAAGRGVVATPFSEDIKDFADVVALAGSSEGFAEAIGKILEFETETLQQLRLQRAMESTWEARVEALLELMEAGKKRENSI